MKAFLSWFLVCSVLSAGVAGADEYKDSIDSWHAKHLQRLQDPDGYLTLVGLYWLKDSPVELPGFGWAEKTEHSVVIWIGCTHGGRCSKCTSVDLSLDLPEGEQRLRRGTRSAYVVKRGPWVGIRMKDSEAATRTGFHGVERFPVDSKWKVSGTLEPSSTEVSVGSVVGVDTTEKSPGWAVFKWEGKPYRALLIGEPDDKQFFMVFSDQSAGDSTYPACRFLNVDRVGERGLVLDFNKATNPACAFTRFATCPLPPKENIFDFSVEAGEKDPKTH